MLRLMRAKPLAYLHSLFPDQVKGALLVSFGIATAMGIAIAVAFLGALFFPVGSFCSWTNSDLCQGPCM